MFNGLAEAFEILYWIAIISIPFAIWKWIEILIWIYNHVSINFN